MNFWVIRGLVAAMFVWMAVVPPAEAKGTRKAEDADVQMLADFRALQRLGAKSDEKSLRDFLRDVSSEYRQAGYGAFAQALSKATPLVALFGEPQEAEKPGTLKSARATLRRLRGALAKNPRIALPRTTGETIPDYFGIATAFTENASRALKNLAAGENVANTLRQKFSPSVITNVGASQLTFAGTASLINIDTATAGTSGSAGLIITAGGTVGVNGSISSGGSVTVLSGLTGGPLTFTPILSNVAGYRWIVFPPLEGIPADWTGVRSTLTLSYGATVGPLTLASGTRIVLAPAEYEIPAGAVELPAGTSLTGTFSSGTLSTPTPTPSPTSAE